MAAIRNPDVPVLVGHPFAPTGRGEDLRCTFRALRGVGQQTAVRDIYALNDRNDVDWEREFGEHLSKQLSSSLNIFHINGDEVDQSLAHIGRDLPKSAYNIVYPAWELSKYPKEWARQLERFDEIWAPSTFIKESIAPKVSKLVVHMPLACEVTLSSFLGRRYFGIPESSYTFLFFFDFTSYIARKNPFAVIEAFERLSARHPDQDYHLVIKSNHAHIKEDDFERFRIAIMDSASRDRITVIDRTLSDNEVKNLIRCSDCFISLHRSEGFGRGLAEAMYLGKPVIATGYSGNLDFTTEDNSCLVRYDLAPVRVGYYPHAEGQVWADPDIDHTVWYMGNLMRDRDFGRAIGKKASLDIRVRFSYRAVGLRCVNRIQEIFDGARAVVTASDTV